MKVYDWHPLDAFSSEERINALVEHAKKNGDANHQMRVNKYAEEARSRLKQNH